MIRLFQTDKQSIDSYPEYVEDELTGLGEAIDAISRQCSILQHGFTFNLPAQSTGVNHQNSAGSQVYRLEVIQKCLPTAGIKPG